MKKKVKLNFYIDSETAEDFKIVCIKNHTTITKVMIEAVELAVKLGIYVDLTKEIKD